MSTIPATMLAMRSLIAADGGLEIALHETSTPEPGPDEVLVQVEATPINPSDLAMMFGLPDLLGGAQGARDGRASLRGQLPEAVMPAVAARVGQAIPLGNEGAGLVVKAGASDAAQALLGKRVATFGGGLYAQYRLANLATAIPLPDDVSAEEGASSFVNPLTVLGMVETMRREGHTALIHTAAASNLGQMLNRVCQAEKIPLINVVRKAEQAALLKGMGAQHVVNSAEPDFFEQLVAAVAQTGATLAFDAVGGGPLAGQIALAMTSVQNAKLGEYTPYGAPVKTQVYIYGRLDFGQIEFPAGVGFFWNAGGWLLFDFLEKIGAEGQAQLAAKVISELKTTFASSYTERISLEQALDLSMAQRYGKRATGEKFLICP
ncbi:MAG: zinc-binding dehydrogenase [Pseudomonadota bacterium]